MSNVGRRAQRGAPAPQLGKLARWMAELLRRFDRTLVGWTEAGELRFHEASRIVALRVVTVTSRECPKAGFLIAAQKRMVRDPERISGSVASREGRVTLAHCC